jgi:hypothetical protein
VTHQHRKRAPVAMTGALPFGVLTYLVRSPKKALSNEFVLPFAYL